MHIAELYPGADLHRTEKVLSARFSSPQTVLSTGGINGGAAAGITRICNCQVSEPNGHDGLFADHPGIPQLAAYFSKKENIPIEKTAFLFTAANMNNAVWKTEASPGGTAAAVCTAGTSGNAVRAGDPASYYEEDGRFYSFGTINLIVAVSRPFSPGARCKAVVTATEAKTAALQELQVGSNYSSGLATGTGTDQIAVASPAAAEQADAEVEISDAGTHAKWGEMIARACKAAVKEALELQDGMTPVQRGYAVELLSRYGVSSGMFCERIGRYLSGETQKLLVGNLESLQRDCLVSSALSSLLHVFDLAGWGGLPPGCRREALLQSAAGLARAVAGSGCFREDVIPQLQENSTAEEEVAGDNSGPLLEIIFRAFALGLEKRWK